MNAKEYLGQAYRLDIRINSKLEQVDSLRILATKVTASCFGERVDGTKETSPMGNVVAKIIDLENEINREIDALVDLKIEIVNLINEIENPKYKTLLELRYLCYKSWVEIAISMLYSYKQISRLHDEAIKSADKILIDQEKFKCQKKK